MVAQIDADYFSTSKRKSVARLLAYALVEGRPLTTKGRWVNPFVFAQFALIKMLPKLKQVNSPIYILGTGRSGSTFLGNILSLHPDICYLNEPKALWHSVYPNEDVIGNFTNENAAFLLDDKVATQNVISRAHKLYAYALTITKSNRILDKHGEIIFRISFIKKIFPDAKFIFLARNGMDTVSSVAKWSKVHGVVSETNSNDWWGADRRKWNLLVEEVVKEDDVLGRNALEIMQFNNQLDMAAVEWIMTMKEGMKLINDSAIPVF